MPRGGRTNGRGDEAGTEVRSEVPSEPVEIRIGTELVRKLQPWVDLEVVGPDGFASWLESVLPLVPRPGSGRSESHATDPESRIAELAKALVDCASDRARANFQAAEYYQENQTLTRRMLALEARLRTLAALGAPAPGVEDDPGAEKAARRYLPRNGSSG